MIGLDFTMSSRSRYTCLYIISFRYLQIFIECSGVYIADDEQLN